MIVNYTEEGWDVILQRSHGLLAAQICGQWKKNNQPQRWVETLIATAEHDDGKDELDQPDLIHKNGGPQNFKMNPFDRSYCDGLIELALGKSRYIAILISMHMRFLYEKEASAKRYCRSLANKEKAWISQTDTNIKEVSASYELLEFCDALSLLICQGLVQPEKRKMEISSGPDGAVYQVSHADNGHLKVSPWPFEPESFQATFESRLLRQLAFKTNLEFLKVLKSAPVDVKTLTLARK